jgi:hypothetical protein
VPAPTGDDKVTDHAKTTAHDPQIQESCTISFVDTTHDSFSSTFFPVSLVSGIWLGIALAFTLSGCSSSASGCDGTALDWALLGSLVFQLFFFTTVVWQSSAVAYAGNQATYLGIGFGYGGFGTGMDIHSLGLGSMGTRRRCFGDGVDCTSRW